jgi:uncharacterized protein
MSQAISAPVRQNERIRIIDTIRGVALLGILMMNIPYFANPDQQGSNLNVMNEYAGANYYTWWIVEGVFEGTMRALFSLLFGAGCILLLTRLEKKKMNRTPADIYHGRLLWLFLFGMINAFVFLWPGDILYSYALCGLFLYPFRKMKPKYLLMFAIAFMLFASVKGTYRYYTLDDMRVKGEKALALEKQKQNLTDSEKAAKEKWIAYQDKHSVASLQKAAKTEVDNIGRKGYFGVLGYMSSINATFQSKIFYHFIFFDVMFLLFLGMALFKWNVLTGQRSKKFYLVLMLIGYGIGLPLTYWEHRTLVDVRFDNTLLFRRFFVDLYEERRILLALGHLSLITLLYKQGIFKLLWQWLSKVGQMAFSNYLMQSIFCAIIFYGFGFQLFGKLQRYEEYYVVLCIWIFQVIFSNIWLHYYRFGPFEWLWRTLTYAHRQPMKRSVASVGTDEETGTTDEVVPALA